MRLFLVQCCSAKDGDREIFGEQRSVLADLPPADAKGLIELRSRVKSEHADKFGGKRLTSLALYTGGLYGKATKRLLLDPPADVRFLIMSGGYGLLRPDEVIEKYNVRMDQTYSVWKAGLPAILDAYVISNGITAVHGIVSRTGRYKGVLDAAQRGGVPLTMYALRYTGDEPALRAVPALQAKLLGALMGSDKVDHVDGVPVEQLSAPSSITKGPRRARAWANLDSPGHAVAADGVRATTTHEETGARFPIDRRLLDEIGKQPSLTERELAEVIFGPNGYQQQVNPTCRSLLARGLVERRGEGGPGDPYRYYLKP